MNELNCIFMRNCSLAAIDFLSRFWKPPSSHVVTLKVDQFRPGIYDVKHLSCFLAYAREWCGPPPEINDRICMSWYIFWQGLLVACCCVKLNAWKRSLHNSHFHPPSWHYEATLTPWHCRHHHRELMDMKSWVSQWVGKGMHAYLEVQLAPITIK